MSQIIKYYKPYINSVLLVIALLFLQAMTDLALPDYMSKIINHGIGQGNMAFIYKMGVQMLLLALASVVCAALVSYNAARIAAKSARNIRNAVFAKVSEFSNSEFDRFSSASLITRSTNDIQQIQMVSVMMMRMVFLAPIMGIGALIRALNKSPSMTWTIALALIFIMSIMIVIFTITIPKFKLAQKLVDKLNLVMTERLTGTMVIRAFNTDEHERGRFDEINQELTNLNLFVSKIMVFLMPAMMLTMNGISIIIVWFGAAYIDMGTLLVGDMIAFIQYTMQIIISFLLMSMVFINLPRALVSVQRVSEVLNAEISITDPETLNIKKQSFHKDKEGFIEFRNVFFRYPESDEYVLKDISFVARPGQTTAFIGSTGSGKSTLINLIPRFYDASKGSIYVEGADVRNVSQRELREKIGYIPQKGLLFSGTIGSNLRYADENASEEELNRAAKIAQAYDFISENKEGYNWVIAQGGKNVSGGQKQRISVARALVKKPQIYIFDDSFSALDFKTDSELRKALKKETGDSTILIVAQRISTIKNAEQIIVLEDGNVAGIGRHDELMETCQVYREIALSQLSKGDLS